MWNETLCRMSTFTFGTTHIRSTILNAGLLLSQYRILLHCEITSVTYSKSPDYFFQ